MDSNTTTTATIDVEDVSVGGLAPTPTFTVLVVLGGVVLCLGAVYGCVWNTRRRREIDRVMLSRYRDSVSVVFYRK